MLKKKAAGAKKKAAALPRPLHNGPSKRGTRPPLNVEVRMGNIDTKDGRPIFDKRGTQIGVEATHLPGKRVCRMGGGSDSADLSTMFRTITDPNGIWAHQSWKAPAWVESNDKELEKLLAAYYQCPIGKPVGEEWIE